MCNIHEVVDGDDDDDGVARRWNWSKTYPKLFFLSILWDELLKIHGIFIFILLKVENYVCKYNSL